MKALKQLSRLTLLLLFIGFTSCSDDDNGPTPPEKAGDNIVEAAQATSELSSLEAALRKIEETAATLLKIPPKYIGSTGATVPDIAWYVFAAIKKTRSLSHAFCLLIREKNGLAATALIRLQLDTALRISGLSLVDDLEDAGAKLMNDESFRKLKSRDGKPLTDALLHENLDKHYPGLSDAYKATSSYVVLSMAVFVPCATNWVVKSKPLAHRFRSKF